ncbi:hypothetical protein QQ045_023163 [Rhodiola kirilowii]
MGTAKSEVDAWRHEICNGQGVYGARYSQPSVSASGNGDGYEASSMMCQRSIASKSKDDTYLDSYISTIALILLLALGSITGARRPSEGRLQELIEILLEKHKGSVAKGLAEISEKRQSAESNGKTRGSNGNITEKENTEVSLAAVGK